MAQATHQKKGDLIMSYWASTVLCVHRFSATSFAKSDYKTLYRPFLFPNYTFFVKGWIADNTEWLISN